MTELRDRTSLFAGRIGSALALSTLVLLGTATAGRAAEPGEGDRQPSSLRLTIEDDDGAKVDLRVGTGWLSGLLEQVEVDCDARPDRQTRRMMDSLTEQGEGGVWSGRDDDGDRILARRSSGQLKLESTRRDGGRAVVEMPWPAAECLLLGRTPAEGLGSALGQGKARMQIEAREDGKRVRLSFD